MQPFDLHFLHHPKSVKPSRLGQCSQLGLQPVPPSLHHLLQCRLAFFSGIFFGRLGCVDSVLRAIRCCKPCGTGRAIGRRILAHFFRTTHQPVELGVQVSVKVREVDASGLLHLFLAQFPSIHTLKSNSTKRIFHELVSCEFGVQTNWCSANIPMVVLCQDLSQGMLFLLDVLLERRCCDDLGQHVALRSQHDIRPLCTRTAESQVVILGRFACLFDNGIAGLETQGVS